MFARQRGVCYMAILCVSPSIWLYVCLSVYSFVHQFVYSVRVAEHIVNFSSVSIYEPFRRYAEWHDLYVVSRG